MVPTRPLNPGELQIDLFCKGLRIDTSCTLEKDARFIARTRAGLGSGLEIVIPGPIKDLWMNVPVEEDFAERSPYRLMRHDGDYFVVDGRQQYRYPIRIPPEPSWYTRTTSRGTPMHKVGVLQGTYLGIYISNSCGFWYHAPALNCRFCSTGLNVGVNEVAVKDIDDAVEVAQAAKDESGVTFVHFNSGYQKDRDLDVAAPYVKAIKSRVGALIGCQLIPTLDFWKYDRLVDLGADHFSFCYEFHNREYFAKYLPGKEKLVGQETFFRALEYTAKKLGKGACSGEIIAGVEPLEDTIKAIDYITGLGAFPTVCVFRPTIGTDMEHFPSPTYDEMLIVFRHLYEACRKNNIPIDVTPNIDVSLIVQPGDTRYLAPPTFGARWYESKMAVARKLAQPYFWWKRRPKNITASEILTPEPTVNAAGDKLATLSDPTRSLRQQAGIVIRNGNDAAAAKEQLHHDIATTPVAQALLDALAANEGQLAIDREASGLEVHACGELPNGLPNRARLKLFAPKPGHTLAFFYKRSQVPYSRDRYSYGGIDLRDRAVDRGEIDQWIEFVRSGFHPDRRPLNLRRAFPYEIPE